MAFTHGKDAVFWLDNSAGTLTNISAYVTGVSGLPGSGEVGETTVFGKAAKTFIAGLKDASFSVEGHFDSAANASDVVIQAAIGNQRSFEFGPEGGTTGKIKYSGEAFCTSYDIGAAVDGVVPFSAEFQVSDTVTRGTFA
jgi:hypothetical protein